MKMRGRWLLYWPPRVLGILYVLFISLFALDAFNPDNPFWENLFDFLMHLVPSALVLIALIVAWKWELVGAVIFSSLGVFYIVMAWGDLNALAYLIIAGPLFVIGVLFLVSYLAGQAEILQD